MKKIFIWIIFVVLLGFVSGAPGLTCVSENIGSYTLFVPTADTHQLIVALHGSGERSKNYIKNWLPEAASNNYVVLAIDSHDPQGWSGQDIAYVLDKTQLIKEKFKIKKTLLSGASSGGQFALYLGITYYQYFEAIAVFMGSLYGGIGNYLQYQREPAKRRPIFMVHGEKDRMIPIAYGKATASFLREKGYTVTFVAESEMKHQHYRPENKKIIEWFEKMV